MHQLSGMDSVFLAAESARTPMHVTAVLLYQSADGGNTEAVMSHLTAAMNQAVSAVSLLRKKLSKPPLNNDHSYWVEDPEFVLVNHVQHHMLDTAMSQTDLFAYCAALHQQQLALDKPLWKAHLLQSSANLAGLGNGGFAVVLKVHHAAVDGMSMLKIIGAMHAQLQDHQDISAACEDAPLQPAKASPSSWDMWWNSYTNLYKRRENLWKTVRNVVPALTNAKQGAGAKGASLAAKIRTRFNAKIDADRVFDAIDLKLAEILQIRKLVPGSTVNEVVVSIIAGGLRYYLESHDELPAGSLLCGVPIDIRKRSQLESSANMISMMRLPMASDVADPVERLKKVNAGSTAAKKQAKTMGLQTLSDLAQSIDPQWLVLGVRAMNSELANELLVTPVHTTVSNVPGPRASQYLAAAKLVRVYGLGPLKDQGGLFHLVTSIGDVVSVSFVSCVDMLPDAKHYVQCLLRAYQDLCAAQPA